MADVPRTGREAGFGLGFGVRHPAVAVLLQTTQPVSSADVAWPNGDGMRLRAHLGSAAIPPQLVQSVRCIVRVNDDIVVCENADGVCHPWPGGRLEAGETPVEAAVREVREETGWLIDPDTIEHLGWLHMEHLSPRPSDYPYPHPDAFQLVIAARADARADAGDTDWTDTEGYELRSKLVPLRDADSFIVGEPHALIYLDALRND